MWCSLACQFQLRKFWGRLFSCGNQVRTVDALSLILLCVYITSINHRAKKEVSLLFQLSYNHTHVQLRKTNFTFRRHCPINQGLHTQTLMGLHTRMRVCDRKADRGPGETRGKSQSTFCTGKEQLMLSSSQLLPCENVGPGLPDRLIFLEKWKIQIPIWLFIP